MTKEYVFNFKSGYYQDELDEINKLFGKYFYRRVEDQGKQSGQSVLSKIEILSLSGKGFEIKDICTKRERRLYDRDFVKILFVNKDGKESIVFKDEEDFTMLEFNFI